MCTQQPTNHLDVLAVIWLTDFLVAWPGTLVVVSHARSFLNEVCTDIVHLHARTLTTYRGDYDCFEATRAERQRNAAKAAEVRLALAPSPVSHSLRLLRSHLLYATTARRPRCGGPKFKCVPPVAGGKITVASKGAGRSCLTTTHPPLPQSFIDKFRFNAKRAALVQSRIKLLERMGEAADVEVDPETVFTFPEPAEASGALISFDDVCFTYAPPGGRLVFDAVTFGIDAGSRLAIVGPNGVGKSTLLGLVSGALQPTSGRVTRSPKLRVATFAQHHVDGLELGLTPLAALVRAFPGADHQLLRCHLGAFGVTGPLALQPMYTLSGGQKSRVAIAKVTWPRPNVLLLDEVTNHLDFDAVEALIEGLALWPGGLLLVSHDQVRPAPHVSRRSPPAWPRKWLRLAVSRARAYRPQHFIESVCDSMWVAEGGRLSPFDGTFSDCARREGRRGDVRATEAPPPAPPHPRPLPRLRPLTPDAKRLRKLLR